MNSITVHICKRVFGLFFNAVGRRSEDFLLLLEAKI